MKFMQLRKRKTGRMRAWMELIRLSEIFTVPGDFLAGCALAAVLTGAVPSLFRLICGSLGAILFYCAGRIYKDILGQSEDYFQRPERPLPSRRITGGEAVAAALVCLSAGFVCFMLCGRRALLTAAVLAVLIAAYDLFLKDRVEAAVVSMGLCRGLCFLIGAGISGWHPGVFPVFLSLSVYAGMQSWFADGEERHQIPGRNVFYPAGIFISGWILVLPFLMFAEHFSGRMLGASMLTLLVSCSIVLYAAVQIFNRSVTAGEMQRYIGRLDLALLPWQVGWILLAGKMQPRTVTVQVVCLLVVLPGICRFGRTKTGAF